MVQADIPLSEASEKSTFQFGTWYPIESAPKDHDDKIVILFWPHLTAYGFVASGYWYEPGSGVDGYWYSELVNGGASPPTHWMPLPPPPSNDDRTEEK